jgi:hypothetical protein
MMTVSDRITMDGKYAYAFDPSTKIRILCVDRPGGCPIVAMDTTGAVRTHKADGCAAFAGSQYAIVPLRFFRRPVEAWAVLRPDGTIYTCCITRKCAEEDAFDISGSSIVRLIEVEDAP